MSLFNALKLGNTELAAGRLPPSPLLLLDAPEIGPRGATGPPLCDEGMIAPSMTQQDTQFGQGVSLFRAEQFPLKQYPIE